MHVVIDTFLLRCSESLAHDGPQHPARR
jgi:hypothetical protein